MGQIGRAAQQIRQRFGDRIEDLLRGLPAGDRWPIAAEAVAQLRHGLRVFAGQFSVDRVMERRAGAGMKPPAALDPASAQAPPADADLAPGAEHVARYLERR